MCRTPSTVVVGVVLALALGIAGCGTDDDFANEPRDPAPIIVSASIAPADVTVSPSRIGAGRVELIASNLTSTSRQLTLSSRMPAGGGAPVRQRTGPINPGDAASLTADLAPGTYRVSAGSETIAPATLHVGPPRGSARDTLLAP